MKLKDIHKDERGSIPIIVGKELKFNEEVTIF